MCPGRVAAEFLAFVAACGGLSTIIAPSDCDDVKVALQTARALGAKWVAAFDIDAEAVAALREDDPDHHLPKSDLVVYVTRVALDSARDMSALQDAILGRFQPTEKAVAEAAATFPGQVQGA